MRLSRETAPTGQSSRRFPRSHACLGPQRPVWCLRPCLRCHHRCGGDSFRFSTAIKPKGSNIDTIADFSAADDTILLDNAIFKKLKTEGVLVGKFFEGGKKANSRKDAVLYNEKTGDLLYDKNGSKKGGTILFAKVEGSPDDVSAADFLVI